MPKNEYISGVPNGVTIGGAIAFVLGFIPIINLLGAFIGGVVTSYVEEYPILKSTFFGGVVGLVSLAPWIFYTVLSFAVLGGASNESALAGLGALGGFFGGFYAVFSAFAAPFAGAAGGFSLGIYFHLIYKATDDRSQV